MELRQRLNLVFRNDRAWLLLLALATAAGLTCNLIGLLCRVTIVIPNLLYFPIIIASYRFPRKGVVFASSIGLLYFVMVCLVPSPAAGEILSAAARFVVFVAIGWIVAYLSLNLREQEERYRGLFDHSEAGSLVVRLDGPVPIIEDVNFRGAEILGTRAAEMAGEPLRTFWDDPGNLEEFIGGIRKNGARYSHEARLVRKDGAHVEAILSAGGVSDLRFIVTLVDITDRKRTEDAFRQANRELNLLSGITRNDLLGVTGRLSDVLRSGKERCRSPEARELIGRLWDPVRYIRRRLELDEVLPGPGSGRTGMAPCPGSYPERGFPGRTRDGLAQGLGRTAGGLYRPAAEERLFRPPRQRGEAREGCDGHRCDLPPCRRRGRPDCRRQRPRHPGR